MSEVKKVFSVGDIVSFAGVKGEVISNESTGSDIRIHGSSVSITTPILVLFENGKQDNFTEDGKLWFTSRKLFGWKWAVQYNRRSF